MNAEEAEKIINEVHTGVYGPHMNGYVLAKIYSEQGIIGLPWNEIAFAL